MRKLLFFLFAVSFSCIVWGQQMTDDQIMLYAMQAQAQGVPQQKIASELLKRGATMDQLKRLSEKYTKSGGMGVGTSMDGNIIGDALSGANDRTRRTLRKEDYLRLLGSGRSDDSMFDMEGFDNYGYGGDDMYRSRDMDYLYWMLMMDSLDIDQGREIYGHSIFRNRELTFEPNLGIATPENYQLGPGDEVIIDIWGASQNVIREIISPDGVIIVDNLGPVYLNGLTVKDANKYLKSEFSKIYSSVLGDQPTSQINLSLGDVRTIQVNIVGEVKTPGTYTLSSFATVFHALYQAEGMSEIGSLRKIKVYRQDKLISTLDIYEYLMEGKMSGDIRLRDNDAIFVEPYGNLVNIVGKVKRPMFYELLEGETVEDLLKYAGGFTGDAYKKSIRLIRKSGREHQIYNIGEEDMKFFTLMDEDSLTIDPVLARFSNLVEIRGAVYRPGMYQMDGKINTLKTLINAAEGVRGDAFLNRGVLHREKDDLTLEALSVDIKKLIAGEVPDIPLRSNDVFFIPSINEIQEGRSVIIHGEVATPGNYPYVDNTTLEDLILQAGGLLEAASTVRVDVSRRVKNPKATFSDEQIANSYSFSLIDGFVVNGEVGFVLEPFDEVYVRRSPGYQQQQNIEIEGEVLFGGIYSLTKKNQRLSEVISLAGGLTPEAYAKGARLERTMTPEEKLRLETLLKMTENKGANETISSDILELGDKYYVGIELDKALANPGSDADIVLREDDRIIVPQFTSTVKINGAVMHPNTVGYKKGKGKKYYIDMAGGYAIKAKKSRAYVIYMNGTVAKLNSSSGAIQPGCEIVVPTKQPRMGVTDYISLGTSAVSLTTMIATLANLFK